MLYPAELQTRINKDEILVEKGLSLFHKRGDEDDR